MILPGIAPMYVFRCPRISASSRMPPRLRRTNFLPSASAIDFPRLVLPTPGGPMRQRIGLLPCGFSFRTARYSMRRRFTLSRPK